MNSQLSLRLHTARAALLALGLTMAASAPVVAANAPSIPPTRPEIVLFNGTDLKGWRTPTGDWRVAKLAHLDPANDTRLLVEPGEGVLVNGLNGKTTNLLTDTEHGDAEVHLEFLIARHSNSGIYFQGRYEIQVYDSHGVAQDKYPGIECGGIYPRWLNNTEVNGQSPRVNTSKPAGEWQTFHVIFRAPRFDATGRKRENARFVKVVHNGTVIHENVELTGPTRAAQWENDEQPSGPLMLQGDHGPVAYRNLRLKPLQLP